MKYFLDHPQIKRNKSWGNGESPKSSGSWSGVGKAVSGMFGGSTPQPAAANPKKVSEAKSSGSDSIAKQINFGGQHRPKK